MNATYIIIDLGAPGVQSQDIAPEAFGPFATRKEADDSAEAIDANGGVSWVVELQSPECLDCE